MLKPTHSSRHAASSRRMATRTFCQKTPLSSCHVNISLIGGIANRRFAHFLMLWFQELCACRALRKQPAIPRNPESALLTALADSGLWNPLLSPCNLPEFGLNPVSWRPGGCRTCKTKTLTTICSNEALFVRMLHAKAPSRPGCSRRSMRSTAEAGL